MPPACGPCRVRPTSGGTPPAPAPAASRRPFRNGSSMRYRAIQCTACPSFPSSCSLATLLPRSLVARPVWPHAWVLSADSALPAIAQAAPFRTGQARLTGPAHGPSSGPWKPGSFASKRRSQASRKPHSLQCHSRRRSSRQVMCSIVSKRRSQASRRPHSLQEAAELNSHCRPPSSPDAA